MNILKKHYSINRFVDCSIVKFALFALAVAGAWVAQAETVSYLEPVFDSRGAVSGYVTKWAECAPLNDCASMQLNAGWYQVSKLTTTISDVLRINGNVKIVLRDNTTLKVGRVEVKEQDGVELTIYAQSTNETTMGALDAIGQQDNNAGIGGSNYAASGKITINGGMITAKGGENAAGIGGGNKDKGKNITINGGIVEAKGGKNGAGIGGGDNDKSDGITINGGKVTANGGTHGAGIGGGSGGTGKSITITGGTVTAEGGEKAAGIGGGKKDSGDDIKITGGIVEAKGGFHAAGIGSGNESKCGTITITGGTVTAKGVAEELLENVMDIGAQNGFECANITITGGSVNAENIAITTKVVNDSGVPVHKTTVTGVEGSPMVIMKGLEGYGVNDLYPHKDKLLSKTGTLYFWLPEGYYAFYTLTQKFEGYASTTITGEKYSYYGISVNTTEIGKGSGDGWTFDKNSNVLTLSSDKEYELSGTDNWGVVQVKVTANANVTLDNLTLPLTKQWFPIQFTDGTTNSLILKGENTVYGQGTYAAVCVGPSAMVTLSGTGKLVGSNHADSRGFHVDGTLVMNGGTIYDYSVSAGGGGVVISNGGAFTMNGGTISGCSTRCNSGGAIYNGGAFTMNGGTINGCSAINYGGAIYNEGTLTINGGTISGCSASIFGGAIYNEGSQTINGGTISGCSAYCGGALFNDGTANIYGGTLTGNSAANFGGFCYCNKDHAVSIYGGYFSGNAASSDGCNLYVSYNYEQNGRLYGGVFSADPLSDAESRGCLVLQSIPQGDVAVTKVGNFYVVGKDVTSLNGDLMSGTYTFNLGNTEYCENAGLKLLTGCEVTEQVTNPKTYVVTPPDAEFRVNNVRVKDGPGEGWSFDTTKNTLVLSNDMTYVLSGYCNESYSVDVTANATVEFSNVRIHAGDLEHAVFNITGANVTLTLGGSNEVYTTDHKAAFSIANGATLTLNAGDGVLWGGKAEGANSRCVSVADGGAFVMNGGEIRGYTATLAGSVVHSAGEATINGGTIAGNGGVELLAGAVAVRGGVFEGNSSTVLTSEAKTLYGGIYDEEPLLLAVADGYERKRVGDLWVVGQDVQVKDGQLAGGTYTFDPKGDAYAAAGLKCGSQYDVVPQGTDPETYAVQDFGEFRVNDVKLERGSGIGWSFTTNETGTAGCLTLSKSMRYTLTGYSGLTLTVDVLSNATVTLDGIRIRADKPSRDIFRVFGDDTTFALSGTNTVYANDGNAAIGVTAGACLTVREGESGEKGELVGGRTSDIVGRGFSVYGELVLESGTIRDYYAGHGGGVFCDGGTFTMNGGEIAGCAVYLDGSGISPFGGGIYLQYNATCNLNGGTISGCSAMYGSAFASMWASTAVNVRSGFVVSNNVATGHGTCFAQRGKINIWGGTYRNNRSNSGVFVSSWHSSTVNVYGGVVTDNIGLLFKKNETSVLNVHGGVYDAEPGWEWIVSGSKAEQVGDLWVVGTDVAGAGNTLSYGTYTFDPQEDEYAAAGLGIAERHIVTAQGTSPETYLVDWNNTGLKIGYQDDDDNIVDVKDVIVGSGNGWSFDEESGIVTINAVRYDQLGYKVPHVILGQNTREDLDLGVSVIADNVSVMFTNATIATTAKAALAVDAANVTMLMAGDSKLTSKKSDALTCSADTSVTFQLANGYAQADSATLTVSSIGGEGTVSLGGESYWYDDKCGTIEVTDDIDVGTLEIKSGILKVEGDITGDTITVIGGRTKVKGSRSRVLGTSGIVGGTVTIEGGTIVADTIKADGSVVITGGSVKAGKVKNPVNDDGDTVWCVTVPEVTVTVDAISCGYTYGDNDIYPIDEEIYLWMPNSDGIDDPWVIEVANDDGWYEMYYADVNGAPTVAYKKDLPDIMLYVNGEQVNEEEGHNGWSYDANNCVLTLTAEGTNSYVITGMEMDGRVRIVVAGSCDVAFTGQLGTQDEMTQGENLIVIGNGTDACMVNMEFADTTSFKVMPDSDGNFVAAVGVEQYATLNIVGNGTAYNFAVDLRGEGDDKGKITMADPTSITYTTEESAKVAAETIQPVADETYFPGIDQNAYAKRVTAVTVETSSGTWTLDYQISEQGTNDIVNVISSVEVSSNLVENITLGTPTATFYPVPGFYYALPGSVEIEDVEDAAASSWYRGQQDQELTVEGPTFTDTDKAFYQLRATLKP